MLLLTVETADPVEYEYWLKDYFEKTGEDRDDYEKDLEEMRE